MTVLGDIISGGETVAVHAPCPRVIVDENAWASATGELAGNRLALVGLWGDDGAVHMALRGEDSLCVLTLPCPRGRFPSVGRAHPPALRLERAVRDLYGYEPDGTPDPRPWLDHGRFGVAHPLGDNRANGAPAPSYAFLPVDGEDTHQIPVGPVHAGIIEPGHFRFTAQGETIVRLEERLGYVHKGIDALMRGAPLGRAAQIAGRTSGDSTVAYSFAFARAAEAAMGVAPPPRAVWLRALMAELERLANHFGDIGAICNDASFALLHAQCGILRERVLRASDACFGHRMMRDRIVPGGVATDIAGGGAARLRDLVDNIRARFPELIELYDNTASLQDRTVATGMLAPALAALWSAGGYVGRASGRAFDARRAHPYPPYDTLAFETPLRDEGDVNARVWIRIREVEQSLAMIGETLLRLPDDDRLIAPLPARLGGAREGMALVEGFRGDVLAWVRLGADMRVERCHLRDPSWFQWPLLEAVIEGNIVADFPLCNKSFNCSYSGHDL